MSVLCGLVDDSLDVVSVQRFLRQQGFGEVLELPFVLMEQFVAVILNGLHRAADLLIDDLRGVFAEIPLLRHLLAREHMLRATTERERPEPLAHFPLRCHTACRVGRLLQVRLCAATDLIDDWADNIISRNQTG